MNYLNSLYQQVLLSISIVLSDCEKQVKVGRPPKVSDLQLACLYVMSYITNTPVLYLAKILIDPSIQSYHLFRKYRTTRGVYLIILYLEPVCLCNSHSRGTPCGAQSSHHSWDTLPEPLPSAWQKSFAPFFDPFSNLKSFSWEQPSKNLRRVV